MEELATVEETANDIDTQEPTSLAKVVEEPVEE